MELSKFVSETLKQIVDGVRDAQQHAAAADAVVVPKFVINAAKSGANFTDNNGRPIQMVEFDVALTSVDGETTKGGIGVFFAGVGVGAQGQAESQTSASNRIRFSVPLCLPRQG